MTSLFTYQLSNLFNTKLHPEGMYSSYLPRTTSLKCDLMLQRFLHVTRQWPYLLAICIQLNVGQLTGTNS